MDKELEGVESHVDPVEEGLTELKDSFRRLLSKQQTAKYVADFDTRWDKLKAVKPMRDIKPCTVE